MTHKVGAKGQVVIPKEIRDRVGLRPGDLVDFERRGDDVVLRRVASPEELRGALADGPDLLEDLMDDKQRERARESRRAH